MMLSFISYSSSNRFAWLFQLLSVSFARTLFKMPRVTRNSQAKIEFRVRKTRSQQKENVETETRGKQTPASTTSPRKRRDATKGKRKSFYLLPHLVKYQTLKLYFEMCRSYSGILLEIIEKFKAKLYPLHLKFPAQVSPLDSLQSFLDC